MGGKMVVSRKVVLGIAVSCLILLVIVVGSLENQNRGLQSQVASQNTRIDSLNATLNSTVDSMNATIANLQSQLSAENATNTLLQGQLKNETSSLNSANSQVSRLQNQLSFADESLREFQSQISFDQSTITGLKAQITNLQTTMANWNNQVTDGFSLIQITDTQYLSYSNPALFNTLTSWIAQNAKALNVSMVIHTGDIVQAATNATNWQNANNAMMQLYNNGVPYCWDGGNHDFIGEDSPAGNDDGFWIGGQGYSAFNVTTMQREPYWVASIFSGSSTAVQFSYGNYRFMVINVAYDANDTVLDWMQTLIKCNPTVNIIVATHNFLNGVGGYGYAASTEDMDWARNFENIVGNYTNVFMTLSGHDVGEGTAYNQKVGGREEIFFNRQEFDAEQGAACARIYTFNMTDPANPAVNVYTYQLYAAPAGGPGYISDPWNQFTFKSTLTPYSPTTVSIEGNTDFLGASGFATRFATPITLAAYNQTGDLLRFYNLTLNGATSNVTLSAVGADITVTGYNATSITYTVGGGVGTQTFFVNTAPTSVNIDGTPAQPLHGWTYSNGVVTVTDAANSVIISF